MPESQPSSTANRWIDRLSRRQAMALLVALLLALAVLICVSLGIGEPVRRAGPSDLDTYQRVVAALRAGQGYYAALHDALLTGGYGTTSPLNWRVPVFLPFLALFPSLDVAHWALGGLTVIAWGLGAAFAYRHLGLGGAVGALVVLALSLISIAAPRAELSFELCAGTLILISVSAYGLGWRWAGVAAGAGALFVRELAAIYALVSIVLALRERRWREAAAWLVVLVAYGAFYFWQMSQVVALLGPDDHAAATGWLQFGGLEFVLRTAAFNGVLLVLPYWVAALVLVIGLVGLKAVPRAAWPVALWLVLFLVYGRPENEYWGALYAPLIALGLVFSVPIITALVVRSRRSS
ncbi:MAG: hypothetical protein ABI697_13315 [Devosia sp.]